MTNDDKLSKIKIRKILKVFIIILAIVTIVLAVLSLTLHISYIYALITLIIESILTRYRNSIDPKK